MAGCGDVKIYSAISPFGIFLWPTHFLGATETILEDHMLYVLLAGFLFFAVGNTSSTEGLKALVVSSEQPSAVGKAENEPTVGTVARVSTGNSDRDKNMNDRLHFCVFDNGKSDYIYVGTKYGMWSNGEFDVSVGSSTVFSGKVPHMIYGGVVIQMGDVLTDKTDLRNGVRITKVTGIFK